MYSTVDSMTLSKPKVRPWGVDDACIVFGPFVVVVARDADIDALMVAAAEAREMLAARRSPQPAIDAAQAVTA